MRRTGLAMAGAIALATAMQAPASEAPAAPQQAAVTQAAVAQRPPAPAKSASTAVQAPQLVDFRIGKRGQVVFRRSIWRGSEKRGNRGGRSRFNYNR